MAGAAPRVGAGKGARNVGVKGIQKAVGKGDSRRARGSRRGSGGPSSGSNWALLPRVAGSHADRPPERLRRPGRGGGFGFPEGEEEEPALDRGLRGREAEQHGAQTNSSVSAQFRGSGCRAPSGEEGLLCACTGVTFVQLSPTSQVFGANFCEEGCEKLFSASCCPYGDRSPTSELRAQVPMWSNSYFSPSSDQKRLKQQIVYNSFSYGF